MLPNCVFGILNTETGMSIANEMLQWLTHYYYVYPIYHDGTQFEYPALKYMQELCKGSTQPCLYLHTKGACNHIGRSMLIRDMWEEEFGRNRDKYFELVSGDAPKVATQFTGADRLTRYNGFVANAAAMAALPPIEPSEDRMVYERMFFSTPQVEIIGTIYNDITNANLKKVHNYLEERYG